MNRLLISSSSIIRHKIEANAYEFYCTWINKSRKNKKVRDLLSAHMMYVILMAHVDWHSFNFKDLCCINIILAASLQKVDSLWNQ